jgi:hypothetical protein
MKPDAYLRSSAFICGLVFPNDNRFHHFGAFGVGEVYLGRPAA